MSLDVSLYVGDDRVFDANITHNLTTMADKAGIYEPVWRPEEVGIVVASQLIEPLRKGIDTLAADPDFFATFDAENKWGTYEQFLPWLRKYLAACEENPTASVSAWR